MVEENVFFFSENLNDISFLWFFILFFFFSSEDVQKITRANIKQEEVQPGSMFSFSSSFSFPWFDTINSSSSLKIQSLSISLNFSDMRVWSDPFANKQNRQNDDDD